MLVSHHSRHHRLFAYLKSLTLIAVSGVFSLFLGSDAGLAVLLAGTVLWSTVIVFRAYYYQLFIGNRLRIELGFTHGTCYMIDNGRSIGVITLASVTPGGVFDLAGFRVNDILLDDLTITDFYELLERQ